MKWFATIAVCFLSAVVLCNTDASALKPTMEGEGTISWPSVQGNSTGTLTVSGTVDLSGGKARREKFPDIPAWIVSKDFDGNGKSEPGILFNDGTLRILSLENDRLRTISSVRKLAPASPPIVLPDLGSDSNGGLAGVDDRGDLVTIDYQTGRTRRLAGGFSPLTYPTGADLDGDGSYDIAAVNDKGKLTVVRGPTLTRSESSTELLPDTRIIALDLDGKPGLEMAAFTSPTDEKAPGRLGDDLEAKGFAVFSWDGRSVKLEDQYLLDEGELFEMILPVAVTDPEDERPQLMFTVSGKDGRTGVRSYTFDTGRLRQRRKGPVIGDGMWIHPLGGAIFGDSDRVSLAAAVLPEEGDGDLELYRVDLAQTRLTLRGAVRSQQTGSRLMETSLVGDFNRDGRIDLLVPGPGMKSVRIITLEGSRLKAREIFNASGRISTNFCPGDYDGDGNLDIMFGLDDGTVVILQGE
ncbi:MAG: hypothetical protein RRA32_08265 [bacterium]|nr:hypothetical protein [bacterium]